MKLDDINKENIFRVPDQYFEEFPNRLQDRIRAVSGKGDGKLISLPTFIKMSVAASILVLISFGIFHMNSENKSNDRLLADVPTESLIDYLEESDLSVDELIETIDVGLIISDDDLIDPYIISDGEINDKVIEDIITEYELELQM